MGSSRVGDGTRTEREYSASLRLRACVLLGWFVLVCVCLCLSILKVAKHDAYQRELKAEMDRLEEKMKAKMEEEETAMRDQIKKLNQQNAKSSSAIETMRQQVMRDSTPSLHGREACSLLRLRLASHS